MRTHARTTLSFTCFTYYTYMFTCAHRQNAYRAMNDTVTGFWSNCYMYINVSSYFFFLHFCSTTANAPKVKTFVTGHAFCHLTVVETTTRTKNIFLLRDNRLLFLPFGLMLNGKFENLFSARQCRRWSPLLRCWKLSLE